MYYQENLKALQEFRPSIYDVITGEKEKFAQEDITVSAIATRTDEDALEVTCGDSVMRLNSKYDPGQEAQRWALQHKIKNLDTVVAMFGLGNGIFLREMLKKIEKENYIIVYEPSYQIFRYVIEHYRMTDIRVLLIVQEVNESEYPLYVSRIFTWMNLYSRLECFHPNYDVLFPTAYEYFHGIIQDNLLGCIVTKNTHEKLGKTIVYNTIHNMKYLKDSITFWDLQKRLPKDVPVIIVSAGPSLLKNIHTLKEAKGKAIIISVDRAYETLIKHGIEPDFIAHLDSVKNIKAASDPEGFSTPMLCKLEGSRDIFDGHKGKKIIFHCSDFMSSIYAMLGKEFVSVSTGGSITTAVFSIVVSAGFWRVVLVGSDLAYQNGLSHAGMNYLPEWNNGLIELFVDDIYGNKIQTRFDWYSYLRWLEAVILQLPDYDIIDATEGGAMIKGTRIMTLEEVLKQYCNTEVDCLSILEGMDPTFDEKEIIQVRDHLLAARAQLLEIQEKARRTIYDCQKLSSNIMLNQGASSESRRLVRRLQQTNAEIENTPIFTLINQYILSAGTDDIGNMYIMTNDQKRNELSSYQSTELIYTRMREACDFILPILNQVIEEYR